MTFFIALSQAGNPQSCLANPSASVSLPDLSAERSRLKRALRWLPTSRMASTTPDIEI
jgi:hypothetical protein